jgi:hypothetical protein
MMHAYAEHGHDQVNRARHRRNLLQLPQVLQSSWDSVMSDRSHAPRGNAAHDAPRPGAVTQCVT